MGFRVRRELHRKQCNRSATLKRTRTYPFEGLQAFLDILANVEQSTSIREHVVACRSINVAARRIARHHECRLGNEHAVGAILGQLNSNLYGNSVNGCLTEIFGCRLGYIYETVDHVVSIVGLLGADGLAQEEQLRCTLLGEIGREVSYN